MITRKDLSEEQELALQYMIEFTKSTNRQMMLAGFAGTGKSTLLKMFLAHMKEKGQKTITCTAPTNEAVRVIAKITKEKYTQTIYSLLGLALVHEDDKGGKLKSIGTPKINEYDIVIIDEASMVDSEVLAQIELNLMRFTYVKVIYVGDDAQLPPILDANKGIKQSRVFELKNRVLLTQVMRTANGNPIIKLVTAIRNNLKSAHDCFERESHLTEDGNGVKFYDERDSFMNDLYNDFMSDEYKKDNNYVRAIAYTNKAVYAMNINIRKKIFNKDTLEEYVVGENLIVDEPITERINSKVSKIIFTAGERLRVIAVDLFTDDEYGFRTWNLRVINYEEDESKQIKKTISVIHKDDVEYYYAALEQMATKAKHKMMKRIPNSSGTMKSVYTKQESWAEYFRFKEGYAWVKYAYAMTVHKVQGSTVNKIYAVERDMNILSWDDETRNKLKYVAFTRASHNLNILH